MTAGGPVVTVPADIVTSNPVVTFTVTATDVIDGPVDGDLHPALRLDVRPRHDDGRLRRLRFAGNAGFGSFNVTVSNGPVLTLPADITAEATSAAGAAVSYTVTATDNATIVCTPASGSTFATRHDHGQLHRHRVDRHDERQLQRHRSRHHAADDHAPDVTAEATGPSGAAVTYSATATDLVDGSVGRLLRSRLRLDLPARNDDRSVHGDGRAQQHRARIVPRHRRDTTPPTIVSITAIAEQPLAAEPQDGRVTVTRDRYPISSIRIRPSHIVSVSSNQPHQRHRRRQYRRPTGRSPAR